MEKAIKTLAICIVVSALLVSATILATGRYKVYPTNAESGLAIRLDTITGDVKALTISGDRKNIYCSIKRKMIDMRSLVSGKAG